MVSLEQLVERQQHFKVNIPEIQLQKNYYNNQVVTVNLIESRGSYFRTPNLSALDSPTQVFLWNIFCNQIVAIIYFNIFIAQ